MKYIFLIILIFGFVSCSIFTKQSAKYYIYIDNDSLFALSSNGYIGADTLIQDFYKNGELKNVGRFAINENKQISHLKIGFWIEYYENGKIKSKGEYDISSFIQCCFGGLCRQFLNYKIGEWIYYYPSGQIRAKGYYDNSIKHISTSCEGGDTLRFHEINSDKWDCYNESGQIIYMSDSLRLDLEKIITKYSDIIEIMYPDTKNRNELIWEWKH